MEHRSDAAHRRRVSPYFAAHWEAHVDGSRPSHVSHSNIYPGKGRDAARCTPSCTGCGTKRGPVVLRAGLGQSRHKRAHAVACLLKLGDWHVCRKEGGSSAGRVGLALGIHVFVDNVALIIGGQLSDADVRTAAFFASVVAPSATGRLCVSTSGFSSPDRARQSVWPACGFEMGR